MEEQLYRKMYPSAPTHAVRKKNLRNVGGQSQANAVLAYMDLETTSREVRYDRVVPTDQDLLDAESLLSEVVMHLV